MIVVVESPCAPQPAAVEKFKAMTSTCGGADEFMSEASELMECRDDDWINSVEEDDARIIRLRNTYYARAAMLDCLLRGEAPYLSHLLYTQVLNDDETAERQLGMEAGIELSQRLLLDEDVGHVFYDELGVSGGMKAAAVAMSPDADVKRIDYGRRQLGPEARAWYLERVPASIAWLT